MTDQEVHSVGLDIGTYAIKMHDQSGQSLQIGQASIPGNFQVGSMLGMKAAEMPMRISLSSGAEFFIGAGSHDAGRPIENLDMERFNGTPEMTALIFGALTRHIQQFGPFQQPLALTVGLPLQTLTEDVIDETVQRVQAWLKGNHSWQADDRSCEVFVRSVRVTSQPVGGLFDFLLDGEGRLLPVRRQAFTQEIGTITIGMNTLELLVSRQKEVIRRFTLGSTVGVRRLLEIVNGQRLYTLGELDNRLRNGTLDVSNALPIWERELMGEIERAWGQTWKRFEYVLIMGGGAILLRKTFPYRFGDKAVVPADPVFAVASGLWKLGMRQQRR